MEHNDAIVRIVYTGMAAIAGAITALGAMRWREMTRGEVFFTVLAGFSFAFFVTPWVAHEIFGIPETNSRAVAGLTYLFGSGSNILLPLLIRRLKRALGDEETPK